MARSSKLSMRPESTVEAAPRNWASRAITTLDRAGAASGSQLPAAQPQRPERGAHERHFQKIPPAAIPHCLHRGLPLSPPFAARNVFKKRRGVEKRGKPFNAKRWTTTRTRFGQTLQSLSQGLTAIGAAFQ